MKEFMDKANYVLYLIAIGVFLVMAFKMDDLTNRLLYLLLANSFFNTLLIQDRDE